jgi:hypothetical protein
MSTSAQDAPTAPAESSETAPPACPRCNAPLRPGQQWCLECGAAARTRIVGPRGWRFPVILVGLVALLAGAGVAVWLVSLSDDATTRASTLTTATPLAAAPPVTAPAVTAAAPAAKTTTVTKTVTRTTRAKTVTAPARTVSAPAKTVTTTAPVTTTAAPTAAAVPSWPAGQTGYTVVVLSAGRATAYAKARKLTQAGTKAGVLDTNQFDASDATARYVVFSGRYTNRTEAEPSLTKIRHSAPNAYVGYVTPR